jgi:hypothetical protein
VSTWRIAITYVRFVGYMAMLAALLCGPARPAAAADFWMASVDPALRGAQQTLRAPSDYMDLFRPDASWATAASGLKVFKISTAFGLRSTDENMQTLVNDLKRRHIAARLTRKRGHSIGLWKESGKRAGWLACPIRPRKHALC